MTPATSRPAMPNRETIGARMTTNAAVGPVTWKRDPPSSGTTMPATMEV